MRDGRDLFKDRETTIGYVETDVGGILIADAAWEDELPRTTQERLALDLDIPAAKIPIIAVTKNEKRFLILAIDDAKPLKNVDTKVEVESPVEVPEEKKEESKEKDEPSS